MTKFGWSIAYCFTLLPLNELHFVKHCITNDTISSRARRSCSLLRHVLDREVRALIPGNPCLFRLGEDLTLLAYSFG